MFDRSGRFVVGVCEDHKLRLWDVATTRLLRTVDIAGREVAMTAMSDDGEWMVMGDYHGDITVWNTATGQVQSEQHLDRYLTAAAFSHDGRRLALAPGSPVRVYDLLANRVLYELDPTLGSNAVVFSRDDGLIASADGDGIRVYDARMGKLVSKNADFLAEPLAVEFARDAKSVIAAGGDRAVLSIDVATGKTLRRMAKTAEPIFYLEVSPDGRQLAVVTQRGDNPALSAPVIVAELPSLQKVMEWMSPTGVLLPSGAAWSRDGHFVVATATSGALHLRRVR